MATIVDVARTAGVSVATVSRVLNGKAHVKEDFRRRVMDAVETLHYMPNQAARNLRRNESRAILILAPNVTNPYYTHIIAGIGEAAHEYGYSSFLCNTYEDRSREEDLLKRMELSQADGAILLATALGAKWLVPYAQKHPIVQCSEFDPEMDILHVSIDNYQASRDVMAHLLGLGHKRIGLITSTNRYYSTALRTRAYRDALAEADLPAPDYYIREGAADYTFTSGFDSARSLLSQEKRPTALFCISDMLALGSIASAREMGFRVPEDVTVVGFDDVEHTTMFHPYVTTVVQPCFDIGYRAMGLLQQMMCGQTPTQSLVLPHSLVVRESSAPRHHDFEDLTTWTSQVDKS